MRLMKNDLVLDMVCLMMGELRRRERKGKGKKSGRDGVL